MKRPASIASVQVLGHGDIRARCQNSIRLATVSVAMAELTWRELGCSATSSLEEIGGEGWAGSSRLQSRVAGQRVPCITMLSAFVMMTEEAVKVAVHPWSQSRPIEIRDPVVSFGKMWASQAASGRKGMSKMATWLDLMEVPSGSRTEMLGSAGRILVYGAVLVRKWPVHPVSAMIRLEGAALGCMSWTGGGDLGRAGLAAHFGLGLCKEVVGAGLGREELGLSAGIGSEVVFSFLIFVRLLFLQFGSLLMGPGIPPLQALCPQTFLEPPIRLLEVASSLWSSALFRQEALVWLRFWMVP